MGIFDFLKKKDSSEIKEKGGSSFKKVIIDLQNNTHPKQSTIEEYWFENENIGLQRTQFHRITIPLKPFISEIENKLQLIETDLIIDWLNLNLPNPDKLDGITIKTNKNFEVEASIYIGNVHNPVDILKMTINKVDHINYRIIGKVMIDFEHEMIAKNEIFNFKSTAEFKLSD